MSYPRVKASTGNLIAKKSAKSTTAMAATKSNHLSTSQVIAQERESIIAKTGKEIVDLRMFGCAARQILLGGELIRIQIGEYVIPEIPKKALIAVSPVALKQFKENRQTKTLFLSTDSATVKGVQLINDWLKKTCRTFTAFELPTPKDFAVALRLYQTAQTLGIETGPGLPGKLRKTINQRLLEYSELDVAAYLERDDPIFEHLAHALAAAQYKKEIPDPEVFEGYLKSKNHKLAMVMSEIDSKNSAARLAREAEKKATLQKQKEAAKARQQERRQQAKAMAKVGNQEAEEARKLLELANFAGGVQSVTPEMGEKLRAAIGR